MPYEEIYFQRLEQDNPEDYEQLKSKKLSYSCLFIFHLNYHSVGCQDLPCLLVLLCYPNLL